MCECEADEALRATVARLEGQAEHLRRAVESRDVIGQAKGIIMATMHCTPDEAFVVLKQQSQAENRKLAVIAAELAGRFSRRAAHPN